MSNTAPGTGAQGIVDQMYAPSGVTSPNLGEPQVGTYGFGSLMSDVTEPFSGVSGYAQAGQFGGGNNADVYQNDTANMGQGIQVADAQQGAQNAQQLQALGAQYGGQAQGSLANSAQALGSQQQALGMYQQAAAGNGPSAAQAQLQSGLDQSLQAQQAQAASTRGGFGLANAQHDASVNSGQLQGQAANNAAQLRAQEQQAGMAGYATTAAGIQAQQSQNAQAAQAAQLNAQNAANTAQYGWTGMGQQSNLNYNQLGEQALQGQLTADTSSQQTNQQAMTANAANEQKMGSNIMNMAGGILGAL